MNTDELHNILLKRKTFFCYSGPLTEKILTAISVAVRLEIGENAGNERAEKKVFGNFVEQAQNIIKGKSFLKFNELREKLIKVLSKSMERYYSFSKYGAKTLYYLM